MTRDPILLVGAGGHARACLDVIEQEGRFVVKGLVGLPKEVGSAILNNPVLGTEDDLSTLLGHCANAIIAIGQIKTPDPRIRLFNLLQQNNCALPTIRSPRAYVSPHANLEAGTIVMHGAVINAGVVIGKNCIINSQSLIEHDVIIADHCHIATAATINSGGCICDGCVIGMGQPVLANCKKGICMS